MRPPAALLFSVALAGCAHPRFDGPPGDDQGRVTPDDFKAHTAEINAFLATIPLCADGQEAMSVEEARRKEYTPGDCVAIEGQLVVDTEPRPCGNDCTADWMLLGDIAAPPPLLPGVRRYTEGPGMLGLRRDRGFGVPRRECERDAAGQPRLANGIGLVLPDLRRERRRDPAEVDLPSARVVILGQVHDHCRDYPQDRHGDRYGARLCDDVRASRVHLNDAWSWLDIEQMCLYSRQMRSTYSSTPGAGRS